MGDDTEIERIERKTRTDDVARIKIQRDNALLDMERFWKERDALAGALADVLKKHGGSGAGPEIVRARAVLAAVVGSEKASGGNG